MELGARGHAEARRWSRRVRDLTIVTFESAELALRSVTEFVVADAAIVDAMTARQYADQIAACCHADYLTAEFYAGAVSADRHDVLYHVNNALLVLLNDGTIDRLLTEFIGPDPAVRAPLAAYGCTPYTTRMTRIGLDARLTAYRAGGTSTYIRALASAIADMHPPEQMTIIQKPARPRADRPAPAAFDRMDAASSSAGTHRAVRRACFARFDVLHSPDFIPPWHGGRRHVITVHDLAFLMYPQQMTADSQRYYNDQIAWAVERADHILAVSSATRDDLIRLLNVRPDRITVQYHGVDPAFYPMDGSELAQGLAGFSLTPGYLLFVGTIGPRKNIEGLCEGYRIARESVADIPPLVIVGEGGLARGTRHDRHTHNARRRAYPRRAVGRFPGLLQRRARVDSARAL
ncbi:MAG: glycosyltransferase [Chloroflexi bacterium]|nr:glycosyltransferase [Chloroflexota bacterium]